MGWFTRREKSEKLAAPQDNRKSRASDSDVHRDRGTDNSRGPSYHRDHSAPNNKYTDHRHGGRDYHSRGRRASSYDGGAPLPPPRNRNRSPDHRPQPMAIDMDAEGVSLKSGDGSAIRMRHDGLDLTSKTGQTISLNTRGPPPNSCTNPHCGHQHHSHPPQHHHHHPPPPPPPGYFHGGNTYGYPQPQQQPMGVISVPQPTPAIGYQQTVTTYPTAVAPMGQPIVTTTPAFQVPTQGTMHNVSGIPVVIPVQPRYRR